MGYHDVRLPDDIERGAKGGPRFNTSIIAYSNGSEQRNATWQKARMRWDIGYGMENRQDFIRILDFFYARRGSAYSFPFKDWSDYKVTSGLIGLGDGANKEFQLIKSYEPDGPLPYVRIITRPVAETLQVFVDGAPNFLWTLGDKGLVTFTNAPGNDIEVTATFEFDVPVRFEVDEFDLTLQHFDAGMIESIPVVEMRE